MEHAAIGRQLRARRTAAGRTVASVAADAGLSVPYVANLENGRGNPTTTALTRLAGALGMRLVITLVPDEDSQQAEAPASPEVPASLVRLGRTARFRQAVTAMATALDLDTDQFSAQLVAAAGGTGAYDRQGPRRTGLVAPAGRAPADRRSSRRAVGGQVLGDWPAAWRAIMAVWTLIPLCATGSWPSARPWTRAR